uniref:Uncharacterized protein n=1 Tax=Tetradesmus obliquus TaxID=3088 RepID=A0A383WQ07_TETOB|eukprot:jgi/Sobl393_1/18663/SZX61316.1
MIRSELAALPNLQSIKIEGHGAAACLSSGIDLGSTFSQLTFICLGSIKSQAGIEQLLPALPASLVQLDLGVDLPKQLALGAELSDSDRQWLLQLQRGMQMAHLTSLTKLAIHGNRMVIEEHSLLPPNLVSLRVPMVMHEGPLLQLTRLQHLDIHSCSMPGAAGLAGIARCLTQLTSVTAGWVQIEDEDAPQVISDLAMLPLKSLNVLSYGPPVLVAAADGIEAAAMEYSSPAAVGALLGQLTGLTRLELATGAYRVADVAASLAHLTGLQELELSMTNSERVMLRGRVARYEALVNAIVASKHLRKLRASFPWFEPAAAEGDRPHPIMCLQAVTQLTYLDLKDLEDVGSAADGVREPDWAALLQSLPGVKLGQELTNVKVKLLEAQAKQLMTSMQAELDSLRRKVAALSERV